MTNLNFMFAIFLRRQQKTFLFIIFLIGSTLLQSFNEPPSYSDTIKVFETPKAQRDGRQMLSDFVNNHLDALSANRKKELSILKTPAEWKARQDKTRGQLEEFFGKFPEKTPLNARTAGKIEHELYTIEKVLYESQPDYYVSANFYVPKNRAFPVPGVLFTCGHSNNGKASNLYHSAALGLVMKGYAVLLFDPMGQGERSEYPNVLAGVRQHHYIGRPSFLLNKTLSGLRVWDAIRSLDYLTSRPEVDSSKLAAIGNSGGGQMALLITAVDKRIKVCAASHPGGSMESTYLMGQSSIDQEVLSLIPPRPLRIIVGDASGEGPGHTRRLKDIQLFSNGLGYKNDRTEIVIVDGVHDMKLPKREATYEWLNKWFGKEMEGKGEPFLTPEQEKNLWCTPGGSTINAGSVPTRKLNKNILEKGYKPANNGEELKARIASRIKLNVSENRNAPKSKTIRNKAYEDLSIEKLTYESETGITIPALLIKSKIIKANTPVYLYVSDKGKPVTVTEDMMPLQLARDGFIVLAIDVRGTGELRPTNSQPAWGKYVTYTSDQWKQDGLAIRSAGIGRTMIGMRTFDVLRGVDYIYSRKDLKGRNVVVMGEGLGGLWATLGSVFDKRIAGVVTIGTLTSYKPLITNQFYNVNPGYFWLPGALLDFDIPDLIRLVSPKPNIWIDPINELGEKLDSVAASTMIKHSKYLQIITTDKRSVPDILNLIKKVIK